MSIRMKIGAVDVSCDSAEEAVALTAISSSVKPPKSSEMAKLMTQPVTLVLNGVSITCETPGAAAATLMAAGAIPKGRRHATDTRAAQSEGQQKAWKAAEEFAATHGKCPKCNKVVLVPLRSNQKIEDKLGQAQCSCRHVGLNPITVDEARRLRAADKKRRLAGG